MHEGIAATVVIPTAYAREGRRLYLHGARGNRMLDVLAGGAQICVTVALIDGLVLARSAMHPSMSSRSVVVFGSAREVNAADESTTPAAREPSTRRPYSRGSHVDRSSLNPRLFTRRR